MTSYWRGMELAERKLRSQLFNSEELEDEQKDLWTQQDLYLWTAATRLKF